MGSSGYKGVSRLARGINDAIHRSGDLVTGMAGQILGKGIAKELAAGSIGSSREQFGLLK